MNERIQNLKDKIWTEEYWTNPNTDKLLPAQLNKFAELIVRECAQVSEDDITDGDACCTNTADRIARQIREHFGVEESRREKFRKSFEEAFRDGVDLSGRETP